ncbi:MAG: C-5 cytosine-specific DNA methylase [Candidatus Kentron sp. G]|nr:MAG: C-5 cytosine-specific DNA methylase [Candidatus Kentron sp. G]VFN00580.1 MAG: C-5 cytosine-specific DNA methylase [Candidatus Kentron sp. G]VFN02852.1 MAG: C-5 cytosine-specific DNA methylase [Candidatus Kentron sp. G]
MISTLLHDRRAIRTTVSPCGNTVKVHASVIDVFCGAGGLTHGFKIEGFPVACGIDVDEACRYPFETNNDAPFIRQNVATISSREVAREFYPHVPRVLAGCAPCQPFSLYNQRNDDPKWQLVGEFSRLIREIRPDVVTMENVPRLMKFRDGSVFHGFAGDLLPRMVGRDFLPGLWRPATTFPLGAPGVASWAYRTRTAYPFRRPLCNGARCHRVTSRIIWEGLTRSFLGGTKSAPCGLSGDNSPR